MIPTVGEPGLAIFGLAYSELAHLYCPGNDRFARSGAEARRRTKTCDAKLEDFR